MKILLPKTIAEPWGIPWEQIFHDEDVMIRRIKFKLQKYMNYLREHDWTPGDNPGNPRFSHESMLRGFRTITKRMGGLDVYTEYQMFHTRNKKFVGYAYWIYFRVKKGGRQHAKLFTTDG